MKKNYYNITLALAGLCQSATLIQEIAYHGNGNQTAFDTIIYSITQTDPIIILDIYQHESHLRLGLSTIINLFQNKRNNAQNELVRYILTIHALTKKLLKDQGTLQQLEKRIHFLKEHQLRHFDLNSTHIQHSLAVIYSDLISPLGRKIQIKGRIEYLKQPLLQDKVRALLLGGIRSAILWQQMKGNPLQFIYARQHITTMAQRLLQHC